jgi:hypothetical protein
LGWFKTGGDCATNRFRPKKLELKHSRQRGDSLTICAPLTADIAGRLPSSGGDDFVFATAEPDPVGITAPVQYLTSARGISVPAAEFESGVDRFLNTFAEELGREIEGLRSERSNADYAAWRRMEAKLGFDPDGAPEPVME